MGADMAAGGDDLGDGDDLSVVDLAMCPMGPEVCGNGCDDDRNGYTDDDDPACTTQLLVTMAVTPTPTATPALWRLILEPTPHVAVLDGNPVAIGGMPTFNSAVAPAAFIAFDSNSKMLKRVPIGGGGATTSYVSAYTTRDVCTFNGEVIVVEPLSPTSHLHRFMPDGQTPIGLPVDVTGIASACASDGAQLYVATHTATGPSQLAVFAKSANGPVATGATLNIPDALLNDGYARLVDFAYVKKSGLFIGLFSSKIAADSTLDGQVMAPFTTDGGAGGYIDGGVWHGAGEFLP
jgi:hypothetical protein